MQNDGTLKITFSHQDIANITNITYQATPWFEQRSGMLMDLVIIIKIEVLRQKLPFKRK